MFRRRGSTAGQRRFRSNAVHQHLTARQLELCARCHRTRYEHEDTRTITDHAFEEKEAACRDDATTPS